MMMSKEITCKCGCGETFYPMHWRQLFVDQSHNARWQSAERYKRIKEGKPAKSGRSIKVGTEKLCECGCGEMFRTEASAQLYITGHYTPEVAQRKRKEAHQRAEIVRAERDAARKQIAQDDLLRDPAGALRCEHKRGPSCGHSDPPLSISKCGCLQIRARGLCPAGFVIARG